MIDETLEPFEWVEIDQAACNKEYAVTCSASLATGGTECYNTRSSCQDSPSFGLTTLTLRFCKSQAFLPQDGNYYIPSLVSVSVNGGSINPIGANSSSTALGTRGGISVQFQDHPHTDKLVDPYINNRMSRDANYIATERGTFWTKWRARNQYYLGRALRYCSGFINSAGQVVDITTRTYFITAFDGPNGGGSVGIQGRDVLSLFEDGKAKAPFASTGRLLNDITVSDTSFTLNPAGIGNDEYPASGTIRIGRECMTFTRSGDVMTVVRGTNNTKADEAKADDTVQLALVYSAKTPMFILEDLIKNFAAIPATYLDLGQWSQEQTDYMPRLYSATITEPTGVMTLVAEMCQEMYFYPLWDERTAKLKVRAVRPADGDVIYSLDDFANLIEDATTVSDLPDQLITQVWVYFGLINPAESASEPKNFAVREIIASDEGLPDRHNGERIKQIFCRWISSINGAAAQDIGKKMLARYSAIPKKVSFKTTKKDSDMWVGDFAKITTRNSVDLTGLERPLNIQIMSAQQSRAGVEFSYTGQEFVFEAPVDVTDKPVLFSAPFYYNVNLRDAYDAVYGSPPTPGDNIRFFVRPGVVIGARGYEFSETFSGSLKGYYYATAPTTITRDFAPLMRREATAVTNFAVGATYTSGAVSYELMSDMREVPPSLALDTGTWPVGVNLMLTIGAGATVIGEGGFCSVHGGLGGFYRALGIASDGGNGMRIRHPITINNAGRIAGGGGGGSPSVFIEDHGSGLKTFSVQPSGTGAGSMVQPALPVADLGPLFGALSASYSVATTPSAGSVTAGGYGTVQDFTYAHTTRAFAGSAGAAGGNSGPSGQTFSYDPFGSVLFNLLHGGRAGYAISEGANLITWLNKGDLRGEEII